jgi:microcystin-dependent protein
LQASQTNASTPIPTGNLFGTSNNMYAAPTNLVSLNPATVSNVGGSQAHLNMQPFLTVSFCIALQGIFPSPN